MRGGHRRSAVAHHDHGTWKPFAKMRSLMPPVGSGQAHFAGTREHDERGESAVDDEIPDHCARQSLERIPDRIRDGDVVGVIQPPVGAGKHLARLAD